MRAYRAHERERAATQHHRSVVEWGIMWPHMKEPKAPYPPVPDILRDE